MTDSLLQIQYQQVLLMWSDVQAHLPRLYAAAKGIVVELGVRAGISTTALLAGVEAHQGELWSVDRNCGCGALFHHPQWRFICADSLEAAAFEAAGMPEFVDMVFIDTDHEYPHTLEELRFWGSRAKSGGVIYLHDTDDLSTFPAVRQALHEYSLQTRHPYWLYPGSYGLGEIGM